MKINWERMTPPALVLVLGVALLWWSQQQSCEFKLSVGGTAVNNAFVEMLTCEVGKALSDWRITVAQVLGLMAVWKGGSMLLDAFAGRSD